MLSLPIDSKVRKTYPIFSALFGYFGAALAAVAHHSWKANEKHNPGEPVHWSIDKSNDHADCIGRHLLDYGDLYSRLMNDHFCSEEKCERCETLTKLVLEEVDALAWRALALNQTVRMQFGVAPMPFNGRHSEPVVECEGCLDGLQKCSDPDCPGFIKSEN